eukprot:Nk52_evm13s2355 gene=Nk52_evmTU13s2355
MRAVAACYAPVVPNQREIRSYYRLSLLSSDMEDEYILSADNWDSSDCEGAFSEEEEQFGPGEGDYSFTSLGQSNFDFQEPSERNVKFTVGSIDNDIVHHFSEDIEELKKKNAIGLKDFALSEDFFEGNPTAEYDSEKQKLRNKLIRDCMEMALSGSMVPLMLTTANKYDTTDKEKYGKLTWRDMLGYLRVLALLRGFHTSFSEFYDAPAMYGHQRPLEMTKLEATVINNLTQSFVKHHTTLLVVTDDNKHRTKTAKKIEGGITSNYEEKKKDGYNTVDTCDCYVGFILAAKIVGVGQTHSACMFKNLCDITGLQLDDDGVAIGDMAALIAYMDRYFLTQRIVKKLCMAHVKLGAAVKKTSRVMPFCSIKNANPKPHQICVPEEGHACAYAATCESTVSKGGKQVKNKFLACCYRNGRGSKTKTPLAMFVTSMELKSCYTYVATPSSMSADVSSYIKASAEVTANTSFRLGNGLLNPEGCPISGNEEVASRTGASNAIDGTSWTADYSLETAFCGACEMEMDSSTTQFVVCVGCMRAAHAQCCVTLSNAADLDVQVCWACGVKREDNDGTRCCVCMKDASQHRCDSCGKIMHQIPPCGVYDEEADCRQCSWCLLGRRIKRHGKQVQGKGNGNAKVVWSEQDDQQDQEEATVTDLDLPELRHVFEVVGSQASVMWHVARKFSVTSTSSALILRFLKNTSKANTEIADLLQKIFKNFKSAETESDVVTTTDEQFYLDMDKDVLKNYNVKELKNICRRVGVKVSGRKQELIDRILQAVEEQKTFGVVGSSVDGSEVKKRVFRQLINKWFMKPIGGSALAKGKVNEDKMASQLKDYLETYGNSCCPRIVEASTTRHYGLLAERNFVNFSTSVDGIIDVELDEGEEQTRKETVAVEIKTRLSYEKQKAIQKAGTNTVAWCNFGDALFLEIVDDLSHRAQVLHHAAVLKLNTVAYVVGLMKGIKYCLFISFPDQVLVDYRDSVRSFLSKYVPFLFHDTFPNEDAVPVTPDMYCPDYHTFKLHYYLWKDMHKVRKAVGKPLPRMDYITHAPYGMWNIVMGMIDKNSKRINNAKYVTTKEPLFTKIFNRFITFHFLNADLAYRFIVCQVFGEFHRGSPTMKQCRKRMAKLGSFGRFLKAVGFNKFEFEDHSEKERGVGQSKGPVISQEEKDKKDVQQRQQILTKYCDTKKGRYHSAPELVPLFNDQRVLRKFRRKGEHVLKHLRYYNNANDASDAKVYNDRKYCLMCSYPKKRTLKDLLEKVDKEKAKNGNQEQDENVPSNNQSKKSKKKRDTSEFNSWYTSRQTSFYCDDCTGDSSIRLFLCRDPKFDGLPSCHELWHTSNKDIISMYEYIMFKMPIEPSEKLALVQKHHLEYQKEALEKKRRQSESI